MSLDKLRGDYCWSLPFSWVVAPKESICISKGSFALLVLQEFSQVINFHSTQINEHQPIGDIEKNGIERASQVFCSNLQYKGMTGEILLLKVFIDMKARINQQIVLVFWNCMHLFLLVLCPNRASKFVVSFFFFNVKFQIGGVSYTVLN